MSHALAVLNSPGILLPTAQNRMQTMKASSTGTTSGSSGTSATTDIGSTFLNLLSTELQNQDPTAPVDSTAMVGQMISLNQLDQLISINQNLGGKSTTTTGAKMAAIDTSASSISAKNHSATPSIDPMSGIANSGSVLPFNPITMMPITVPTNAYSNTIGGK